MLLVLFPPVGLFLMWKFAGWSKQTKWIVTGIVVVVVVISQAGNSDNSSSSATKNAAKSGDAPALTAKAKETTSTTTAPTTTQAPQDALKLKIVKELGTSNRKVERVASFEAQAGGGVNITWAIDENLTSGLTKDTSRLEAKKILQELHDSGFDYARVSLVGTYPLQDQYGNAKEETVVRVAYDKETVDRINFKNIDTKNMFDIADSTYVVPAFQY